MKKIFSLILAAALFIGAQNAFANHIPMPNLPIGETAARIREGETPCGKLILYEFDSGWDIATLMGQWLMIDYRMEKIWIDRNLDGHLDEYWEDTEKFAEKYPNRCYILDLEYQSSQ